MWRQPFLIITTSIILVSMAQAKADFPAGVGILGDSYSDEYQFYSPDRSRARNWVEILAETRGVNFGRFQTSSRGEPRNQGFSYNWARSDATTDDLVATGQHTGLAKQVAQGEVQFVVVFIGGNDFINAIQSSDPERTLSEVAPRALENVRTAVTTILAAHDHARLLISTIPDIGFLPDVARAKEEGRLPARITNAFSAAIRQFNNEIRLMATNHSRIALVDLALAMKLMNLVDRDAIAIAGFKVDLHQPSNDLDHLFLSDNRHLGTLGQGLIAQAILETLNYRFNAGIKKLSFDELVRYAQHRAFVGRSHTVLRPAPGGHQSSALGGSTRPPAPSRAAEKTIKPSHAAK